LSQWQLLSRISTGFLDLLFPLHCLGCGREGSLICTSCHTTLRRIEAPFCQRCGTPLKDLTRCPSCTAYTLNSIESIRSLFLFEGIIRQAILQFKYKHVKSAAAPIGQLMASHLYSRPQSKEILIPVPLHPRRLRRRGYNQSSLLAAELGKFTGYTVLEGALMRVRDTIPQARTKNAAERRSNVRGAFACLKDMEGRDMLLIDDVCTTGATLDACAAALRTAGAGSVRGLTLATEMFPATTAKP